MKYLEYIYLILAVALLSVYASIGKDWNNWAQYGLMGGIVLSSFLYSIRRSLRRLREKKDNQPTENKTQ